MQEFKMTDFTKYFFEGQEKAGSLDSQVKEIKSVIDDLIKSISSATDSKIVVRLENQGFHTKTYPLSVQSCGSRGNSIINTQKHNIAFIRFDGGYPCSIQFNLLNNKKICSNKIELVTVLQSMLKDREVAGVINRLLAEFKDYTYGEETKHCGVQS